MRRLITHDNCSDGLATALIARDGRPSLEVQFLQYGTDAYRNLPIEPGLVFCDISPPAERVAEFVEAGARVLDHHATAREVVEAFGEDGVFADEETEPGVSGAVLAARHLWDGKSPHTKQFASLIGIRDTWQRDHSLWPDANRLHETLMAMPRDYWLCHPSPIEHAWELRETLGRVALEQRARKAREIVEGGSSLNMSDPDGRLWCVFPDRGKYTSDVAECARRKGIRITCGFFLTMDREKLRTVFMLRSDGSVDVGALAKRWGGGGHTRASGFSVAWPGSPLRVIACLMEGGGPADLEGER